MGALLGSPFYIYIIFPSEKNSPYASPLPPPPFFSSISPGLAYIVRSYFESAKQAAARANAAAPVHADSSEARILTAQPQIKRTVAIEHRHNQDGTTMIYLVDAGKYSAFVADAAVQLERTREELEAIASAKLRTELSKCFLPLHDRAGIFADWYFSYRTAPYGTNDTNTLLSRGPWWGATARVATARIP